MLVATVVSGFAVVALFGWPVVETIAGALIGALFFGTAHFFFDVRAFLPGGELPNPPAGARDEERVWHIRARALLWLAVVTAVCVGLAWLADRWDMGAVFVPGQFLGYTAADLVGVLAIRRWERAHGRRVLTMVGAEEQPALYAR